MSRRTLHTRLAATALLVLASACASDTDPAAPTGPDASAIDADIALATGGAIASDLAVWSGSESAVSAGFAATGAPSAGTCSRSGDVRTCTGGREGTLTVQRTVAFFDAADAVQPAYDAATTARIEFGAQVSGESSGPRWSSSVARTRRSVVSGLAGSETQRTWNGTGTATVQSTFSEQARTGETITRTHRMVESDTTSAVVWSVAPRAAYPASGTVVRNVAVSTTISGPRAGSFSSARRVRVTFNGTAQVPLEVSTVGRRGTTVALRCQLDLSTRVVTCPERAGD